MPAPVNYSHLTPDNISVGRKYHITMDEMTALNLGITTTFTYVSSVDFATQKVKTITVTVNQGIVTAVSAESAWT